MRRAKGWGQSMRGSSSSSRAWPARKCCRSKLLALTRCQGQSASKRTGRATAYPAGSAPLEEGQVERRRLAVEEEEQAVPFDAGVATQAGEGGRRGGGDTDAAPVGVVAPVVEGALQRLADDAALAQ